MTEVKKGRKAGRQGRGGGGGILAEVKHCSVLAKRASSGTQVAAPASNWKTATGCTTNQGDMSHKPRGQR